ncbi:DUF3486 family protein [Alteromonas macleodii]|jgi:hypothetical protein|uniref:DUF3486 family protein n=1 Tax=Alteromonas macleodii TaxID=28108 RepID=UPI000E972663|nr:DUF3486 family protein [Alteromonas macleodii]HBA56949.1 hypothetical protein [Alteromonas macleodii]|tara:strand:- start:2024 stop:2596 length:573 start_codon:yes stop_codon:yes gene_type:complete
MSDKRTRGKPSKIDQLPDDIKSELIELLRDKSVTQTEVLERVNTLIREAGLPEEEHISRSGLNRYATRMATVGSRIQEAREVSKQWVDQLGGKPTGEVSKVLIEMVRTLAFDQVLKMSESGEIVEPKFIKDLAVGVEKLEKAATESTKREKEIRKAMAEEAAERAAEVAKAAGLTADGAAQIKREILGIA